MCENVSNGNIKYVDRLVPGETYYFSVSSPAFSGSVFDLCIQEVQVPANNDCVNSVDLPLSSNLVCGTTISGSTLGAGAYNGGVVCYDLSTVWYSFTPTQSAHLLNVSNVQNNMPQGYPINTFAYSIFQGDCGQLSLIRCSSVEQGSSIQLTDLVPGIPCYISFGAAIPNTAISFDLCLLTPPTPPENDPCYGATLLSVNPGAECISTTLGTTHNATALPLGNAFWGSARSDVWYVFTAIQYNHEVTFSNIINPMYNSSASIGFSVFSQSCDQQESVVNNCYVIDGTPNLISGLTPGTTYYIRVSSVNNYEGNEANFNICLTSPPAPANDLCEGALPMLVNTDMTCTLSTEGTTYGSTPSALDNCWTPVSNEVWYTFEATSSNYRLELNNYNNSYPDYHGFELLKGNCGELESVVCHPNLFNEPKNITGLEAGETYYVRIFSQNQPGYFNVCLRQLPESPANDQCEQAEIIMPSAD